MSEAELRRAERAVSWVGWHLAELAGVSVPAVLAATVSGWFAVVSAAVGASWVAHEVRLAQRQRRVRDAYDRRQITTDRSGTEKQIGKGQDSEQNQRDEQRGRRVGGGSR